MYLFNLLGAALAVLGGWLLLRFVAQRIALHWPKATMLVQALLPGNPGLPYLIGAMLGTMVAGSLLAHHLLFWHRIVLVKTLLLLTVFPVLASVFGAVFQSLANTLVRRVSVVKITGLWIFLFVFLVALMSTLTTWRAVLPPGVVDSHYELRFSRTTSSGQPDTIELVEVKLYSALNNSKVMKLSDGACRGNASQGWLGSELIPADASEKDLICYFQAQPGDYLEILLSSGSEEQAIDVWLNDILYTQADVDSNMRFLPIGLPYTAPSIVATMIENATRLAIPGVLLFVLICLAADRGWLSFPVIALATFAIVCATILLRNAWVVEDQFITMRVIENLVHGYGPNFNVGYRVQAYTHPLWMLLLASLYYLGNLLFPAASLTSLYYITALTSLALAAITFVLLFRVGLKRNLTLAFLGSTLLLLSKIFVDHSLSGLENSLLHVLLLIFLGYLCLGAPDTRPLFWPFFIASCIVVTRQDTLILLLPSLLLLLWSRLPRWREFFSAALGVLPVLLWETFSLLYYGFLVPNTAFAKLNTGMPRVELIEQGYAYFVNVAQWDLVAVLAIGLALLLSLYQRSWRQGALAFGVFAYMLYIVWIGGDFMSGRFLTAPLVLSIGLLVIYAPVKKVALLTLAALALLSLFNPRSPLYANLNYGQTIPVEARFDSDIADERAVFFAQTALLRNSPAQGLAVNRWDTWQTSAEFPADVLEMGSIGIAGYKQGPDYILIDLYALADPLLSKLPSDTRHGWRIGHFARPTPAGYRVTLFGEDNHIEDVNLAAYWDKLHVLVHGDLWSRERFITIWEMNTGKYQPWLDAYIDSP